ncbi:unnamed protein product [Eruca vesicaria subsp. sativa]|uniref:Uncharacterized protein n=1 Tax=Eruca vesicaria subsp. sativa TaxID=29727 RepID=A0ABC8IUV7_ERUVS|nr:unnamed protein product [Eruca vesicaria subsp. sativa]
MPDDGNKEPKCLLHEDGGMAVEKGSSEKKEDDSLIQQKKIASNADNNEPTLLQNLASGGFEVPGHDCFVHDTVLGTEETVNSSEQLEKGNEDVGDGDNDSYEKSLHYQASKKSGMVESKESHKTIENFSSSYGFIPRWECKWNTKFEKN